MSDLPLPQENAHARTKVLRIQAENARLKAEVQTLRHQAVHDVSQLGEQSAEIAHLKAEVERLTALVESNLNCSKITMGKSDAVLHERDNLKAENDELHKDYEALADEHTKLIDKNANLKAEVERLRNLATKIDVYVDVLVLENGRLRKAGEEILNGWQSNSGSDVERFTKACWLWSTAKEAKPSV